MRRFGFVLACVMMLGLVGTAQATSIFWEDGEGGSGPLAGTWANLQTAITSAQVGAANPGVVKVSGDLTRPTGNTTGDLKILTGTGLGSITLSGGWQATGGGDGFDAQTTTKSVLNVNGAASANNVYRVLTVTAPSTTVDNFKVTGGYTNYDTLDRGKGGGIYVTGANSTLKNLLVTGNTTTSNYGYGPGGGICVKTGGAGVRISNSTVSNNKTTGQYSGGGGIAVIEPGSPSANPVVIENCSITGNSCTNTNVGSGGGIYFYEEGGGYVTVANCTITDNHAGNGSGVATNMYGSARLTVYGSLIAGNYSNNAAGLGNAAYATANHPMVLANCTIADNTDPDPQHPSLYGIYADNYWDQTTKLTLINCIDASNGAGMYTARSKADTWLLRTTTYEPKYDQGPPALSSPTFLGALGFANPGFHSYPDTGAATQNLEGNLNADPSFVGGGIYRLTPGSNSLDNALLKGTAATYQYVDIDRSGAYTAMVDIIVAYTTLPPGNNLVYTTDLIGKPRLDTFSGLMDRGAYELEPPLVPEPAALGLLLLGLPALVLRRRS